MNVASDLWWSSVVACVLYFRRWKKSAGAVVQHGALCTTWSSPECSGRVPTVQQHLGIQWNRTAMDPGSKDPGSCPQQPGHAQHVWFVFILRGLGAAATLLWEQLLCTAGWAEPQALTPPYSWREELCGAGATMTDMENTEKVKKMKLVWCLPGNFSTVEMFISTPETSTNQELLIKTI